MAFGNLQSVTSEEYYVAMAALDKRRAQPGDPLKSTPAPQRRFPRFQFHESVRIGITQGNPPTYVEGRAVDLAEGGAGVTTGAKLQVGDTVHLRIPLAPDPLHLPARVCYQYGSEYGFEFVALGIPEREYIRQSCKSLTRIG